MCVNQYLERRYITETDGRDEDFFNMNGQAYIQIDDDCGERFEFGTVHSEPDGIIGCFTAGEFMN